MKKAVRVTLWIVGLFAAVVYIGGIGLIAGVDAHTVQKDQDTLNGLQATVNQQQKDIASLKDFQNQFPTGFGLYLLTHPDSTNN